jgi:2-C-methyl-D-erythritol 4-phosphate cytidylyltransferase
MKVWAVVVAAGDGRRFGGRKQFASLGGRALVDWSVETARVVADGVVLVVPVAAPGSGPDAERTPGPDATPDAPQPVAAHGADAVVVGGPTRAASVRAGLDAVPADADVIVVHDGARPLASPALFRAVVDAVVAGADAAVPALPVADTVKSVDRDGVVLSTLARQGLVTVQTPQAFRAAVLRRAHRGGADATDDAGLVEQLGATVRVVPGDPRNLKVTTPQDLDMARALACP